MRKFLGNLVCFAKKHTFSFVILVLLCLSIFIDTIQSVSIYGFKEALRIHKGETSKQLAHFQDVNNDNTIEIARALDKKINSFNSTLSARMDTLGSAIDPDLKRRSLVKKIRTAITENTDRKLSIQELNRIANAVIDFSYENHLTIAMVLAQMKQESDFNPRARSHAQAKGLMQILDHPQMSTAREIAGELGYRGYDIWDIGVNVRFGCHYMRKMLTAFDNNYVDALRAYNFGPHKVLEVKAGTIDYSNSKVVVEGGIEKKFLVDRYGEFELDEEGNLIKIQEEHRYPRETRRYIELVQRNRKIFAEYGLDVVQ